MPPKTKPDVPEPLTIEYLNSLDPKFENPTIQSELLKLIEEYNKIVIDYGAYAQIVSVAVNFPDGENVDDTNSQTIIKEYKTQIDRIYEMIKTKTIIVETIFYKAKVDIKKKPPQGYQYLVGLGSGIEFAQTYIDGMIKLSGGNRKTGRKRSRSRSKSKKCKYKLSEKMGKHGLSRDYTNKY